MTAAATNGMPRDAKLILTAAFVRATSVGMVGVLLGIYLAKLRLDTVQIGRVVALGLAGMAAGAGFATFAGGRVSRRTCLLMLAALSLCFGILAALVSSPAVLSFAAFFGMLNGMGRDRSAALVLEQAALPGLVGEEKRTMTFAWYNVLQDGGGALGSALAGLPSILQRWGMSVLPSFRVTVAASAILAGSCAVFYALLSHRVEDAKAGVPLYVSPASRRVVAKLCALSAMDSLGGGFLTTALLSYWFYQRFGVSEATLAILFVFSRGANALSHFGAAWLAGRIGLLNTMVFTHIPSSLLLMTVPFAPSFPVAVILFVIREGLVEMDVPTRQSYTLAVVRPEERTFASGMVTLVRVSAWASSPAIAGLMMMKTMSLPLYVGSGIKVVYDVLLYRAFRHLKPPEERGE
ncbi:MAG: MFS transporter [Acidobacteriota bacterium]